MSAISTGTDMKTYHGMQHPEQCYYPLVPGYENMGVVVEEGSYAPGFKKGDRVMINECRQISGLLCGLGRRYTAGPQGLRQRRRRGRSALPDTGQCDR